MRPARIRRPPKLAYYATPRTVTDAGEMAVVAKWQRVGLVSMRPVARGVATVELTDEGRRWVAADLDAP